MKQRTLPILAGGVFVPGCCFDGVRGGSDEGSFSGDPSGVDRVTWPFVVVVVGGAKFSLFAAGALDAAVTVIVGVDGRAGAEIGPLGEGRGAEDPTCGLTLPNFSSTREGSASGQGTSHDRPRIFGLNRSLTYRVPFSSVQFQ